eukprot:jgi/Hompol1/1503/HPOL_003210-RA
MILHTLSVLLQPGTPAGANTTAPYSVPVSIIDYMAAHRSIAVVSPLLATLFLGLMLLFLFIALGTTAQSFFCPNLSSIAAFLQLPETVSGVTIAALGNGAADLFSTFAAFKGGLVPLSLGELFGASSFITCCISGLICIVKPSKLPRRPFIRDVVAFIGAIVLVSSFTASGSLTTEMGLGLVVYYLVYVTVVIVGAYLTHRERLSQRAHLAERDRMSSTNLSPGVPAVAAEEEILSYAPVRFSDQSNLYETVIEPLIKHAMPIVFKWSSMTWIQRCAAFFSAPVVFVMALTTPVMHEQYFENDAGDGGYIRIMDDLAGSSGAGAGASASANDVDGVEESVIVMKQEEELPPVLTSLQILLLPLLVCMVFQVHQNPVAIGSGTSLMVPVWVLAIFAGMMLFAFARWVLNPLVPRQAALKTLSILGFIVSMLYISTISNELVGLLDVIGKLSGLDETLLGLTLFAFGNSIGDLVTNVSLAQMGYPTMAIGACYGSPMLNIVLGIGFSTLYTIGTTGHSIVIHTMAPTFWLTGVGLLLVLTGTLVYAVMNQYFVGERFAVILSIPFFIGLGLGLVVY